MAGLVQQTRLYLPRFREELERLDRQLVEIEKATRALEEELSQLIPHGKVQWRYVQCGKKCHCAQGKGHGPYAYLVVRENGRVRSRYLGKDPKLPEDGVDLRTYRMLQKRLRELRRRREAVWERAQRAWEVLCYGEHFGV